MVCTVIIFYMAQASYYHTSKQCKARTPRAIVRKIRWVGRRTCGDRYEVTERKISNSEYKCGTNETATCVVQVHDRQMISLWRGVGKVGSSFKLYGGVLKEGTTEAILEACHGVCGFKH